MWFFSSNVEVWGNVLNVGLRLREWIFEVLVFGGFHEVEFYHLVGMFSFSSD